MKFLLAIVFSLSVSAYGADYTVEFQPADQSISDQQVSSISSSKILDFTSSVLNAISSTLSNYLLKSEIKSQTYQIFTSGSNSTYTTPSGVKWIKVKMAGGGGAGSSSGQGGGAGAQNGSDTIFGSSLLIARGGEAGTLMQSGRGGDGGTATINPPAIGYAVQGGGGGGLGYSNNSNTAYLPGGMGGVNSLGGGAKSSYGNGGFMGAANSGAGGSGAGIGSSNISFTGAGGGAGGYIEAVISNPSPSYQFTIGLGGQKGVPGTNGYAGGKGSDGIIIIEEHYQ